MLAVDAGWLFDAGTTSALGAKIPRVDVQWDPRALIPALVEQAAQLVPEQSELLRTYWYDGGTANRQPIGKHFDVLAMPDVKLRLGRTGQNGQKGVDGLLIHDLMIAAFRGHVTEAVVVTGDEDILEGIETAQDFGVRVHLLEIPIGGVAPAMMHAVDRTKTLGEAFWKQHLAGPGPKADEATPASAPTPTRPPPTPAPASKPKWIAVDLNDLIDASVNPEIVAAGERFARDLYENIGLSDFEELISQRPVLPSHIDGHLLSQASQDGSWLTEVEKRALRDAFWNTISTLDQR